jgi:hypothetical protein
MSVYGKRLLQLIVQHRLDDREPRFATARRLLEYNRLPESAARALLYQAEALVDSLRQRPVYLARPPTCDQISQPDISIGDAVEVPGLRVGFNLTGPVHAAFVGKTGSGKTTAMRRLIHAVHEHNQLHPDEHVSIIAIDRKGGELSDLPDSLGRDHWPHFSIHGDLRLGLQAPRVVPARTWTNILASSFSARAGLIAARGTLARVLYFLSTALNPSPVDDPLAPDFQLVLDVLIAAPSSLFSEKEIYLNSLVQQLEAVINGVGPLFDTFRGLDLERDIIDQRKNLLISAPNLYPSWVRQFVVDLLLNQVLVGRMQRAERSDRLTCLFVIDEADADCSQAAADSYEDRYPPVAMVCRVGRDMGVGLCLGLAALQGAGTAVRKDLSYHWIFRLKDDPCVRVAADTLMLPPGAEAILPALEPGECLVRTDSWAHAMLAKVDCVPPSRVASPSYDPHPFVPSRRLQELPEVQQALRELAAQHLRTRHRKSRAKNPLPEPTHRLLSAAALYPGVPVVRLWENLGKVSATAQQSARRRLEKDNLAVFEEVRLGKQNLLLIEVLQAGAELLRKKHAPLPGKGGLAHRTFAAWLRMLADRRGLRAELEWRVPGTSHPVDVAWKLQAGQYRAFEIVVDCVENVRNHARACLVESAAISNVTFVVLLKTVREQIVSQLEADPALAHVLPRIDYLFAGAIYRELWP